MSIALGADRSKLELEVVLQKRPYHFLLQSGSQPGLCDVLRSIPGQNSMFQELG